MTFSDAILVLCFAVGCSSTVIQPCGPRMCEHLTQMVGTNESSFDVDSLACNITGRYVEKRPTEKTTSNSSSVEANQKVQMRCVMCTEVPAMSTDMRCHTYDGHLVCTYISDGRSCVFTTRMAGEDLNTQAKGINYEYHCGRQSGLARIQRQMSCVLLSRLVIEKTPQNKLQLQQMKPDVKIFLQPRIVDNTDSSAGMLAQATKQMIRKTTCKKLHGSINNKNASGLRFFKKHIYDAIGHGDFECPTRNKDTLIVSAARVGNYEVFDILLGLGADISVVNKQSDSIFHIACQGPLLKIVKRLVDLGANVEKRGYKHRTALIMAGIEGDLGTVLYLLNKGCDVNAVDDDGDSFKDIACKQDGVHKHISEKIFKCK